MTFQVLKRSCFPSFFSVGMKIKSSLSTLGNDCAELTYSPNKCISFAESYLTPNTTFSYKTALLNLSGKVSESWEGLEIYFSGKKGEVTSDNLFLLGETLEWVTEVK